MNGGRRDQVPAGYEIAGCSFLVDSPGFVQAMSRAHAMQQRPRCLCTPDGVPMYVAKLGDGFIVKRMPETGCRHAPGCAHFELPAEANGLAPLLGTAIREDPTTGLTTLRLDFPLTGASGRSTASVAPTSAQAAASSGRRLSLQGLLHYLWDQAGLTRWQPGFAGKRNWATVRRRLMEAASSMVVSGKPLGDRLFIPEPFSVDHKEEVLRRRAAQWSSPSAGQGGERRFMLLVGELKELAPARHGFRAVVKHVPDVAFMLDEPLFRQIGRRMQPQLALWGASNDLRMVTAATFEIKATGIPAILGLTLMPATREWLPVRNAFEMQLVERLVAQDRRFIKGTGCDASARHQYVSATLTDCGERPTCLYLSEVEGLPAPAAAGDAPAPPTWRWRTFETGIPTFPTPYRAS
jgi:hypothetical protein